MVTRNGLPSRRIRPSVCPRGCPSKMRRPCPVNYLTAYHSIVTMGNLQPGDRLLIHGAAGGVGIAAVQIARARGLVIFGTAGAREAGIFAKTRGGSPHRSRKKRFRPGRAQVRARRNRNGHGPDRRQILLPQPQMPGPHGTAGDLRIFGIGWFRWKAELAEDDCRLCPDAAFSIR